MKSPQRAARQCDHRRRGSDGHRGQNTKARIEAPRNQLTIGYFRLPVSHYVEPKGLTVGKQCGETSWFARRVSYAAQGKLGLTDPHFPSRYQVPETTWMAAARRWIST